MKIILKKIFYFFVIIFPFLLASCNSGGGGDSSSPSYTVGGTVAGLNSNNSVVLADNDGNLTTISQNGNFTFSEAISKDSNYKVTVATQPAGETCTVVDSHGYNVVSNVNNVQVICSAQTFTIGGKVENLNHGASVTLYNKTNDSSITVTGQNGSVPVSFAFNSPVAYGSGYSVIVTSQPIGEICAVTNHKNIAPVKSNIANILVTCSAKHYTISGKVNGLLPNEQVTLLNNDGSPLKIKGGIISSTPFTFTQVPSGSTYLITVGTQPANEKCLVSSAYSGQVNSDINNVVVNCNKRLYSITVNVNGISNANSATIENNGSNTQPINNQNLQPSVSYIYTQVPYLSNYNITAYVDGYICTNASGNNLNSNVTVNINCIQHYFPIYAFNPINYDGNNPKGGMVFDASNGYLYGTTYKGGTTNTIGNDGGYGGIYKLDPTTGVENMVYSFQGGTDGTNPIGKLIIANDGNIYGTTQYGGNSGKGTIFKFNPTTNQESIIYPFTGAFDGCTPMSGLIQASDGYLYGTASGCGANLNGTVFKIGLNGQGFDVLHPFSGVNDGAIPIAGVIEGGDGKLYGTTQFGSLNNSLPQNTYGTIYSINKNGAGYSILHSFNGSTDGAYPENGLIEYSPGIFYGIVYYTNSVGNSTGSGNGLIYQYSSSSGYHTVYPFKNGGDGNNPSGALLKGQDNKLYGVTSYGGTYGYGTIYQFNPTSLNENTLYSFGGVNLQSIGGDGINPLGNLLQMSDGTIWGVTNMGNETYIMGSAFKYKP